jgi:hypothetical protein
MSHKKLSAVIFYCLTKKIDLNILFLHELKYNLTYYLLPITYSNTYF